MKSLTPLVKGLITGALMSVVSIWIYYSNQYVSIGTYLFYAIYALGIIWTIFDYGRSSAFTGKFGEIFGQGFRCFIIVTLVMAVYTGLFGYTHPEIAEEMGKNYKESLMAEKSKMPQEVDDLVIKAKNAFVVSSISRAVFGSLIMGVLFTAASSAVLIMRRRK